MNTFMTFDKESAQKAGGGDYINETGAYTGLLTAKAVTAGTGSKGVEFSIKTDDGLAGNYISIYFEKANGEQIKSGYNHIQSLMGLLKVGNIAQPVNDGNGDYLIKEFCQKRIGMVLQKRLYTKNAGGDGYDFQLRAFFNPDTLKTYKEQSTESEAKTVEYLNNNLKDIDERGNSGGHSQQKADTDFDF